VDGNSEPAAVRRRAIALLSISAATLFVLAAGVVGNAAPRAAADTAGSPRLYLKVAGYQASVDMSPPGTLLRECGTYCAFVFPRRAKSVILTARPAPRTSFATSFAGWRPAFVGWASPCSGAALTCTVNLVSSAAVKAAFNPVSLSVRSSGEGGVTFLDARPWCDRRDSGCRLYDYDAIARVRAEADEGWAFSSWSGGCGSAGPTCSVRMSDDRTLTAQFECTGTGDTCLTTIPLKLRVKVKVTVDGPGRVVGSQINCPTAQCSHVVDRGALLSLQARAGPGARFQSWAMTVGACASPSCTFRVFKDSNGDPPQIVAYFKRLRAPPPPPPPPGQPQPPPPPPSRPPPPPSPRARCQVPNLFGLRLSLAKTRLLDRKCSVGGVRRATSSRSLRGRVIGQTPRPGAVRRRGFPVALVVGAPPASPVRCRVPKVLGLRLRWAKARIRSRNCSIGRVRRATSRPALRGRVIKQSPSAGAVRRRGFPVRVVVGRR
jgi:Divergent InlB B-repeat domain/PASTA domain